MNTKEIASLLPGTTRQIKPSTAILYQGEAPRSGYFIKEGIIKVYSIQSSGDEQIVAFFGPGDFFPMPWLFEKSSTSIYYHESLNKCILVSVTRKDIDEIVMKDDNIKNYLLDKLIQDQSAFLMRITGLEQSRAVEKILFTIYYLIYLFGSTKDKNIYVIDIKLTHATIASLIGLTRETTATELNKLKSKKVLSYSKKYYTVNKEKLEVLMGEDSFSELLN
jgi:CRP/FNR family transcriptional regulator